MLGLMIVAENDDISLMIVPDPQNPSVLLAYFQFGDLEFPAVPIPINDLKHVLEVLNGNKKAN